MMDDELNSFEIKSEPLYDPDPLEVDPLAPRPSDYLHAEEGAPSVSLFHFKPVRLEDERKPSIINENLDSNDEDISPVKREPGVTEFKIENGWNPSTFDEDHIPNNENNFPKKRKVDAKEFDEDSSSSSVICVENSIKIEEESSGYSDRDGNKATGMVEEIIMDICCPSDKNAVQPGVLVTSAKKDKQGIVGSRKSGVVASGKSLKQSMNSSDRLYACEHCDYKVRTKVYLVSHIQRIHLGLKPHCCKLCTYKSSLKSTLRRHVKIIHQRIRPYCCEICDYKSASASCLSIHTLVVHHGIKPHRCKICNTQFTALGHLNVHIRSVHLGIKRYTCSICNYKTNKKFNLKIHTQKCSKRDLIML